MDLPKSKISHQTLQIAFLTLVAIFLLVMANKLSAIFNPVLLAFLIAYICNPVVEFLQKLHMSRTFAVFLTYILICAVVVATFLILLPLIGVQINILYEKAFVGDAQSPSYFAKVIALAQKGIHRWNQEYPQHTLEVKFLVERFADKKGVEELAQTLLNLSVTALGTALSTLLSIFWVMSYIVLLPLYTFFLLRSLPEIETTIRRYLPYSRKDRILQIGEKIHKAISAFFRGKFIICVIKGLLTWGALELMGIKFSLIFGGIQGVASIVPFLVLAIGMVPNLFLVFLDMGFAWQYLLAVMVVYGLLECLEGFVLTPWIMGKETGLQPLTVILSLLIGGDLFGLFGLIVAIPVTTTLKILWLELIVPQLKDVLGCRPPAPPTPPEPPAAQAPSGCKSGE